MREESHLDEMRSAIRGDFERLAERRGEQELMRVVVDEPEQPDDQPAAVGTDDGPDSVPEPAPEAHRSWLARFLSP
jgi:hypothetical protein